MRILVEGSGTYTGVPVIGCDCAVCRSPDPRDTRLRTGLLVTHDGFALQIDAGPDFRQQVLRHNIRRIDAVALTHTHADHIFGLDEIRQFNTIQRERITAYARDFLMPGLRRVFGYIIEPTPPQLKLYRPQMDFAPLTDTPTRIGPFTVASLPVPHGPDFSTALKISVEGERPRSPVEGERPRSPVEGERPRSPVEGERPRSPFVYASDISAITPEFAEFMRGADTVMIDGLRERPHQSHLTFTEAVNALLQSRVPRGILTHIGHDVSHERLIRRLPSKIIPAYDGMIIEI